MVLTEEGARVRERSRTVDPTRVAAVLDRLRPEERRTVVEALRRLADAADSVARGEHLAGAGQGAP